MFRVLYSLAQLNLRFSLCLSVPLSATSHRQCSPSGLPLNNTALPNMHQKSSSLLLILLLTLSIAHLSTSQQQCINPSTTQVRAGYWLSNSNHYSPVSQINSTLYTHIYYYSLPIDETSFIVTLPPPEKLDVLASFSSILKSNNPSVKTLLSIGTDDRQTNTSNSAFSCMAGDPTFRAAFIDSAVELARAHAFDGLDLAWHYPSSPTDMANLGILLAEWRDRINEEAGNSSELLLLTATVYFSDHLFEGLSDNLDYPIHAISDNLDWMSAFCFNYHRDSQVTAADAALYDQTSHFSASYGIISWLDAGVPPCKLVLGIPLYGRSWFLKNKVKNGLGAQVVAAGPRQKQSNQTGIMAYFEIEKLLQATSSAVVYDNQTGSTYFSNGGIWVTFDSLVVVEEKIDFALKSGLSGYFLWSISYDDPTYTVSRQAMDVWLRDHVLISAEIDYGSEHAASPAELPPRDRTPTQSMPSSGLDQNFLLVQNYHLYLYVPLFLLYYLTI